eukprot:comp12011_c0_seq1/m.6704 comp12011_c0_seq1/g.6704  ORF comp12011_c0_seq1/g.6704 comp12011_c0_seq1/m.6704 type:complete len:264 (-) comp12011_c0_seq1:463-1254(-)
MHVVSSSVSSLFAPSSDNVVGTANTIINALTRHNSTASTCKLRDAFLNGNPTENDEDLPPTRRIIKFKKIAGCDFGTSLCSYHGRLYVTDVYEKTSAWRVGMQPGDRIDEINGVPIKMGGEFKTNTVMEWLRNMEKIKMTIAETPMMRKWKLVKEGKNCLLGLAFTESGITSNDPKSAAAKAKFRPGDAIVAIDEMCMLGATEKNMLQAATLKFHAQGLVELTVFPAPIAREFAFAASQRPFGTPRKFSLIQDSNVKINLTKC